MTPLTMQELIRKSPKSVTHKLSEPSQLLTSTQSQNVIPAKKSPSMICSSKNFFTTSQADLTPMSQQNLMYSCNDLTSTSSFTKVFF